MESSRLILHLTTRGMYKVGFPTGICPRLSTRLHYLSSAGYISSQPDQSLKVMTAPTIFTTLSLPAHTGRHKISLEGCKAGEAGGGL